MNLNNLCPRWVLKQRGKWGLHMCWLLPCPPKHCDVSGMTVPKPLLKSWPAWMCVDGWQRGVRTKEVWHCGNSEALHWGEGGRPDWEDGICFRAWSSWGPDIEATSPFPVLSFSSGRDLVLDQWPCTIKCCRSYLQLKQLIIAGKGIWPSLLVC